jgi:hypothetical protein
MLEYIVDNIDTDIPVKIKLAEEKFKEKALHSHLNFQNFLENLYEQLPAGKCDDCCFYHAGHKSREVARFLPICHEFCFNKVAGLFTCSLLINTCKILFRL